MKDKKFKSLPTSASVKAELDRLNTRYENKSALKRLLFILITFAAAAVLSTLLWLPLLRIYGLSMEPTLIDGEFVIAVKTKDLKAGDIIAFHYGNQVLVKRMIAGSGEWVMVDDSGKVYVNDVLLEEPYISAPALGDCNIDMPYQVPESRIFVMGDHRSVSLDSRNKSIGCITQEQIVGKLVFRLWPFSDFGKIE